MSRSWSPEVVVTPELARSLIEEQFPELAPARPELLGAGMDNTAYRVNATHVFRFPRRRFALPFLEAETRLLPALAPRLPLPVPVPTLIGRPTERYPWPFAGYRMLPGRTACAATLTDRRRLALAEPLARFVAALHAIPADQAASAGAGPDTLGRLDPARYNARVRGHLEQLAGRGLVEDAGPFLARLDAAPAAYTARRDTLVHGDLYFRHLLIGSDGRLAGVIDWGDVHLGDPAADLMIAHAFLPPEGRDVFCKVYGPVPEVTWRMARLRALWHSVMVLVYADDIGDADLLREARLGLRNVAQS